MSDLGVIAELTQCPSRVPWINRSSDFRSKDEIEIVPQILSLSPGLIRLNGVSLQDQDEWFGHLQGSI